MTARQNIIATVYDKKGKIISIGRNNYNKSHPYQAKLARETGLPDKIYLHAEVDALLKAKLGTNRAYRIKVERFSKTGRLLCAKPCLICQKALVYAGVKIVEHT